MIFELFDPKNLSKNLMNKQSNNSRIQSNNQTIKQSNNQTIKQSNNQTNCRFTEIIISLFPYLCI